MLRKNFSLLLLAIILFIPHSSLFAQEPNDDLIAGFQFRPIIPSGLFRTGPQKGTVISPNGSTQFIMSQDFSYNLGMVIQGKIWRNLRFETGLSLTQRNYSLEVKEGSFDATTPFSILAYEVPFSVIGSIPLSETSWFNNSLGVVFDIFPSDEGTSGYFYSEYALREHEFNPALLANTGFRFAIKKAGSVYLGATYHLPFSTVYRTQLINIHDPAQPVLYSTLSATYFSLNIIYFFFNNTPPKNK